MTITREDCAALDAADPVAFARARFRLPEGVIYLDGNSLGALPVATPARVAEVVGREWGEDLIKSWNTAGWIDLPARVGARIAPLIGAEADEVICADSTSVNLFKLAAAAAHYNAPRKVIVTEPGDFPTDLYMLQGLAEFAGLELRVVERDEIAQALDDSVAALALSHVHYRSGEVHDMAGLTRAAQAVGALAVWDLSHSAGALDLDLNGAKADLAFGCGYKYLNGGPGAPAFVFVARRWQAALANPLSGWMGHAAPFDFERDYRPAAGMKRWLAGTPGVIGLSALEEGVATFDGVAMADLRAKSMRLGDLFLGLVEQRLPGAFGLACPREAARRGSQVALTHPGGYAIVQALIAAGVIGDFRAPDVLRFGFAPLYVRHLDVWEAVERLAGIMTTESWRDPRHAVRAAVT